MGRQRLFALLLASALMLALLAPSAAAAGGAQDSAELLYTYGLLDGAGTRPDGTPDFNLDGALTRGEAITMVVRMLGGSGEAAEQHYDHPFTDVPHWGDPYVGFAYHYGITNGTSAATFGFQDPITWNQYLVLLLRGLGYESDWQDPRPVLTQLGLTEGEDYTCTHPFLRGDMALASAGMLGVRVPGETGTLLDWLDSKGALIHRELPQPALVPGPVYNNVGNTFSVSSGEELVSQFANLVDARLAQVTVQVPKGQEQALSGYLLNDAVINWFPDLDRISSTMYPGQGYFVLDLQYKDGVEVMAWLEGKQDTLSEQNMALYQEAKRVHDALVDSSMSEYERVKAFHDYLCETITYQDTGDVAHTAYGALLNHTCVCEGYTLALDLLCYLSGIDCENIVGTGNGGLHAWSRVRIDGQWYNVDVTWDDQSWGIRYDYFLISDAAMSADHQWSQAPNWPACPADYAA